MTEPPGVLPGRAVIDPHVFISALMAKPGSAALTTAQAVATDHLVFVACPYLLAELSRHMDACRCAGHRLKRHMDACRSGGSAWWDGIRARDGGRQRQS